MLLRALMILMLGIGAAQAQQVPAKGTGMAELIKSMPAKRLKALKATPDGFLEDTAEIIYASGKDGQIDAAGLEVFIAAKRAGVRARTMGFFLAADLNNDAAISETEAALFAGTLLSSRRGKLKWGFDLADADADGTMTPGELRSHAEGVAMKEFDEVDAAGVRSLILFDLDGSGTVAMDEVVTAVSSLLEQG